MSLVLGVGLICVANLILVRSGIPVLHEAQNKVPRNVYPPKRRVQHKLKALKLRCTALI
jgi:hypothetical protein